MLKQFTNNRETIIIYYPLIKHTQVYYEKIITNGCGGSFYLIPYIISFVISRDGCVLDGTNLNEVVHYIDNNTTVQPLGYMVNCAFPSFLCPEKQPKQLFERFIGYQANASSLDHCDLDDAKKLEADELSEWGNLMIALNSEYGVKILGGCCATDGDHLFYIVENKKTNN